MMPKYSDSYYWTADFGSTIIGPTATTTSPIYEGAHRFYSDPNNGDPTIEFWVSDLHDFVFEESGGWGGENVR